MSTPNVVDVLRAPGRLSIDPSSVSTGSYPWGGTGLGVHTLISATPKRVTYRIPAEEYGGVPVDIIEAGESWEVASRLGSMDAAALEKVFSGYAIGTTTRHPLITGPSGVGGRVSARKCAFLFTPDDTDRHPFLLFYAACPILVEDARLTFSASERVGVNVAWVATLDASKRLYQLGRRQDLTL